MTLRESFLSLVRLGLGLPNTPLPDTIDWTVLETLAEQQGLHAIVFDGVEKLPLTARPPQEFLLEWIGLVMQEEARYAEQQKTARKMANLFGKNYIRTYVLKGEVVSECYPKPEHRVSSDMDCFLLPVGGEFDAWTLGNDLMKSQGVEVRTSFYKNSTFFMPNLTVENHKYMTPCRGNKQLETLEWMLEGLLHDDLQPSHSDDYRKDGDAESRKFEDSWLYRPPVMVTALFLIEHAYSHFLHEGLTWRLVLDWMMFSRKHRKEIEWYSFEAMVEEFGFKKFYDSYNRLGRYALGELPEAELNKKDKRMLEDVWEELDLHDTTEGFKGKLNLVGNTLRAWWKYHYFAEITMIHALWIQAYGVLFNKHPKLARK